MDRIAHFVSREQIREARVKDLYSFLLSHHAQLFRREGRCLCMRTNPSFYIKSGIPGYHDFANDDSGNSVDFLVRHLNYTFTDAVMRLLKGSASAVRSPNPVYEPNKAVSFTPPVPAPAPFTRVYAYLLQRGLPGNLISRLIEDGYLYQDAPHGNAVFITPQRDYCELRGTLSYSSKPFHGCRKIKPDRFWYFSASCAPRTALICEAAIDALSLFLLYEQAPCDLDPVFISIGGVSNQQSIDRIKSRIPSILAVDNDEAGHNCRRKNLDIPAFFPSRKDWNEDLLAGIHHTFSNPFPYQTCFLTDK